MSNNYDDLENQIGDLGGTEEHLNVPNIETPSNGSLGRLHYADKILGNKDVLDDEERSSMDEFLKRGNKAREDRLAAERVQIAAGWVPVDRDEMGIRSEFYPSDWNFFIKPAPVMSIKNWTAVDETRADQVNTVMNEIIRTSVRIEDGKGNSVGWGQLNSWDRFWFILKVREATFSQGEAKIEFEDECSECSTDIMYTLTSEGLFYEFPDSDLIEQYWDGNQWNIDPSEYDVDHEPITLYTPKIGKDQLIIEWAQARARAEQKIDENFIKYLIWMIPKAPRDVDALDKLISKMYKEYKQWTVEFTEFMDDVVRNITIDPQENLRCICPNCGQEATSRVRFPNGIKQLFRTETKAKKFGSR